MKIQELFADPNRWCRRNLALDANGKSVSDANSDKAVKWCLYGAIDKCYGCMNTVWWEIHKKIQDKCVELGYGSIGTYNDYEGRTIEEIQTLVKELNV